MLSSSSRRLALSLLIISLFVAVSAAPRGSSSSSAASASAAPAIDNEFVVVMASTSNMSAHMNWVDGLMNNEFAADPTNVTNNFDFGTWMAYSITGPSALADTIATSEAVAWVQPNRVITASLELTDTVPGLRRISSKALPNRNADYLLPSTAGSGVDVYIVDTGVKVDHPQFGSRATFAASFVNGGEKVDGNGHGTHVAGTVASESFGVAPLANILAVRVLDATGAGSSTSILQGLQFVINNARATGKPSVINMSLGGSADRALDRAVATAVANGIVAAVAAGNEAQNACNVSPARVAGAITVGATIPTSDVFASFSNFGACVDISAPGVDIQSTWIGSDIGTVGETGDTNIISGTSMATPHVAGVAALVLGQNKNLSPADVKATIVNGGTSNVIRGIVRGTANLLLFNGAEAGL